MRMKRIKVSCARCGRTVAHRNDFGGPLTHHCPHGKLCRGQYWNGYGPDACTECVPKVELVPRPLVNPHAVRDIGPERQTAIERAGGVEPPRISVLIVDVLGVACPTCGAEPRAWCNSGTVGEPHCGGRKRLAFLSGFATRQIGDGAP